MKKSEANFIPSRSSAGLKLILKVGNNSAASECISLPDSRFENLSSGDDHRSVQRMSPQNYSEDYRRHKKFKKKKRKKEKHEKKKRHHKMKHSDVVDEDFNFCGSPKKSSMDIDTFGDVSSSPSIRNSTGSSNKITVENNIYSEKDGKTCLQKLLDYIQDSIEKRDVQNFFKWPVTDQIAPGYSTIISQPMDLNTMKSKINHGAYASLADYIADFKLMCRNAMVYNHSDTIYYKAAKKLLHFGLKITSPERLQSLQPVLPFLSEITAAELGFSSNSSVDELPSDAINETENETDLQSTLKTEEESMSAEEILAQVQDASKRLHGDRKKPNMGFLRQTDDGFTSLTILVANEGINEETRERPVLLGSLIGKSSHGSSSNNWQPFKEDKRNTVKPVKSLNYGSFGSYAPSYDSTFANVTKEETDLLLQTYGDESAVQYAESVLNFAKDSDYTTVMVDNLLDIMTSGEHRKTKKILEDRRKLKEQDEQKTIDTTKSGADISSTTATTTTVAVAASNNVTTTVAGSTTIVAVVTTTVTIDGAVTSTDSVASTSATGNGSVTSTSAAGTISNTGATVSASTTTTTTGSGLDCLKSLSDLGIDTSFVDYYEELLKEEQIVKNKLMHTKTLLEKLQQTQTDRLSNPPSSLSNVAAPSEFETQLAEKVTENLKNVIKKVSPSVVAPTSSIRKALGVSVETQQVVVGPSTDYYGQQQVPDENNTRNQNDDNTGGNITNAVEASRSAGGTTSVSSTNVLHAPGIDLESELREFLESDTELGQFELSDDDKTIEQMLSESS